MPDEASHRISDRDRDDAVAALRDHLLDGRLTLEEFTDRVGLALRAVVARELDLVRADLPSPGAAAAAPRRRRTRVTIGLLAHVVRRGRLRLGRRAVGISVLSDIDLDLREATIEAASSSLTIVALAGNVDVYVPEGVDVDVAGLAVAGHRRDWGRDVSLPDAPSLRIRAFGLLGTIDVWRVPLQATGNYGALIDAVKAVHRAVGLPAGGAAGMTRVSPAGLRPGSAEVEDEPGLDLP